MKKRTKHEPRLAKANYEALADFRYALRKFLAFSAEAAAKSGLSPQQHQALLAIKGARGRDALSIQEIANRLMLRHHSAGELVGRLGRRGLVRRARDHADGRRVLVELTDKSERLLNALSLAHLAELRGIRPVLKALIAQLNR